MGGLDQIGVGAAGTVHTKGNRHQRIVVDTDLRLGIPGLGTGEDVVAVVAIHTAEVTARTVGMDLTARQIISVGPYIGMIGKEFFSGIELLVTVKPKTAGISCQLHKFALIILIVDIAVNCGAVKHCFPCFCLGDQMVIGAVIVHQQINAVTFGIVYAVCLHSVAVGRVMKAGDGIGVEITVGIEHTGIDPLAGVTAGDGVVLGFGAGGITVLIAGITHHGDSVVHLVVSAVVRDLFYKGVHRHLQIVQITVLNNGTGLVQHQNNVQRGILLDQGGHRVIQRIGLQMDGVGTVILQGRLLIQLQVAFHLVGIAVGTVGQIVDDHNILCIGLHGHLRVFFHGVKLAIDLGGGVIIALDVRIHLIRRHNGAGYQALSHKRALKRLVGIQFQMAHHIGGAGNRRPVGDQNQVLCQCSTDNNLAAVADGNTSVFACPAIKHITRTVGICAELGFLTPCMMIDVAFTGSAVRQILVHSGYSLVGANTQVKGNLVLLGNQGCLQGAGLSATRCTVTRGRVVLDPERCGIAVVDRSFRCKHTVHIAVQLGHIHLIFIQRTVGMVLPH